MLKKNAYSKQFLKVLREDNLSDAMKMDLESELNKDIGGDSSLGNKGIKRTFDNKRSPIEGNASIDISDDNTLKSNILARQQEVYNWLEDVIVKVDDFVTFINDPMTDGSVRSALDSADDGTLLSKIKDAESRKLTRAASELSAVAQALRAYIGQDVV